MNNKRIEKNMKRIKRAETIKVKIIMLGRLQIMMKNIFQLIIMQKMKKKLEEKVN